MTMTNNMTIEKYKGNESCIMYHMVARFDRMPPTLLTIEVAHNHNDNKVVRACLDQLTDQEVKHLVKLSCCQIYTETCNTLPTFMRRREGQYFFDHHASPDFDTHRWSNYKRLYMQRRNNILSKSTRHFMNMFLCFIPFTTNTK